jgi:hypothetical protein
VDRVILSADDRVGDGNDFHLANVTHTGVLDVEQTYDSQTDVTLPDGISGDFFVCVHTDASNQVAEFIFEGNNVTCSEQRLTIRPAVQVEVLSPPEHTNANVDTISLELTAPVVGGDARDAATYSLLDLTTSQSLAVTPSYTDGASNISLAFSSLVDGPYRLTAFAGNSGLRDLQGAAVDGDGDGGAGGDLIYDFVVDRVPPVVTGATIQPNQIEVSFRDEGGVDPASATDQGNYELLASGGDGIVGRQTFDFESFTVGDGLDEVNAVAGLQGATFEGIQPATFQVVADPNDAGNQVVRAETHPSGDDLRVSFAVPMENFRVEFVDNPEGDSAAINASAYDASGVRIAQASSTEPDVLELNAAGIAYVVLESSSPSIYVDNISYGSPDVDMRGRISGGTGAGHRGFGR